MIKLRAFVSIRGYIDLEADGKVPGETLASHRMLQDLDRLVDITVLDAKVVDSEPQPKKSMWD